MLRNTFPAREASVVQLRAVFAYQESLCTIIEADTNRRAALPYTGLDPRERLDLIARLGALRG